MYRYDNLNDLLHTVRDYESILPDDADLTLKLVQLIRARMDEVGADEDEYLGV